MPIMPKTRSIFNLLRFKNSSSALYISRITLAKPQQYCRDNHCVYNTTNRLHCAIMANMNLRLVDGYLIRQTLDDDFHALHASARGGPFYFDRKLYIPENEMLLDLRFKNEQLFLLDVFEASEKQHISKTRTYAMLRDELKKEFCIKESIPEFKKLIRKENDLKIMLVDGSLVRKYFDPEFVSGGHRFVYDYIPESEIWEDVLQDKREIEAGVLHEQIEYMHMKDGASYDLAHEYARVHERQWRREHGGGYNGDAHEPGFPWTGQNIEEIIKNYYV